uniref:6-methylsalicylate decarboxylase n=1 Tax=Blastobotrys adeninivorans TaxID=409370 RepID=A0A060TCL3_BLAAD
MSRIDVHHHFITPEYRKAIEDQGGDPSGWPTPQWSLEDDMRLNREIQVGTTILSVTAPGCTIVPDRKERAALARSCNEYAKAVRDKYPKQYGFFATLPSLLDTEDALAEIAYACDELNADGVCVFTRYGPKSTYLGNPAFDPIWEELNRRSAVVFVHPTHPVDTNPVNGALPQPIIDYPHESTRAACDLLVNAHLKRFPNVKVILSHGGGTLPYIVQRASTFIAIFGKRDINEVMEEVRSFYYDLALVDRKASFALLRRLVSVDHILFGSDFPYAFEDSVKAFSELDGEELSDEEVEMVGWKNAVKLFPRLGSNYSS